MKYEIASLVRLHPESRKGITDAFGTITEVDHGVGIVKQKASFQDFDGLEYIENYVEWADGHAAWYADWELYEADGSPVFMRYVQPSEED